MRQQRKMMMVETTYAFVKLKQIKVAVSAGGMKVSHRGRLPHHSSLWCKEVYPDTRFAQLFLFDLSILVYLKRSHHNHSKSLLH